MSYQGQGISESVGLRGQVNEIPDITMEKIRRLVQKFGNTALIVNRLDYYGNSIPIAAFCNAIAFILYGFRHARVYKDQDNESFLYSIILFFGGVGQITSGFLEFIKGRAFTASTYLCYGFYCITFYFSFFFGKAYYIKGNHKGEEGFIEELGEKESQYIYFGIEDGMWCAFFGAWMVINIPLIIASIKTNVMYVIQTITTFLFFLMMCIGYGAVSKRTNKVLDKNGCILTAGIFETISGFVSLYIFCSQMINEQFRKAVLTCVPLVPDNEIDMTKEIEGIQEQ